MKYKTSEISYLLQNTNLLIRTTDRESAGHGIRTDLYQTLCHEQLTKENRSTAPSKCQAIRRERGDAFIFHFYLKSLYWIIFM